jgi:hypothetical protein
MNPCQETSGFLFPHPCGLPGVLRCTRCGKFICMQHARPQALEQFLCVTCARMAATTAGDTDTGVGSDWDDDDDPYFYSSRYRERAGGREPDPKDFTEGDQAAVAADEDDFEDDPGAS